VCERVDELLGERFIVCEPVLMEVLAGARDEAHLRDLRGLLARGTLLSTRSTDFEEAAALYRACRRRGGTVRRVLDCLIAAIAVRASVPVLHNDSDFVTLAQHTALVTEAPAPS
jgi:predicted nucleic acid-binding protein